MVTVEFMVFAGLVAFVIWSAIGWWTERKRRIKMERALKSLEHLQNLTSEIIETKDKTKCATLNKMIDGWNTEFSSEVGYSMPNIDCSAL